MTHIRTAFLLRASAALLATAYATAPAAAAAQARDPGTKADTAPGVPRGMMPPSGKCRVWMDGVPATRQPAPTDCAIALRQKPSNARVIYGPNTVEQREAGLRPAREKKPSLLTPIGERRPALVTSRAATADVAGTSASPLRTPAATRADTHATRVAAPGARTTPATRPATKAAVPKPPPAPTKVPPKKPERP